MNVIRVGIVLVVASLLTGAAQAAQIIGASYGGAKVRMWDLDSATELTPSTNPVFNTPTLSTAWGIAADKATAKIYAAAFTGATIYRYNFNGSLDTTFGTAGSVDLPQANSWNMTIGPDGNLYAATASLSRIYKVNVTTGVASAFITFVGTPYDLVFGPDGHLYVADGPGGNIYKFNGVSGASMGNVLPYDPFNHSTGVPGSTYSPIGIDFAPDGTVYITDSFVNETRIRHYSSSFTWINDLTPGVGQRLYASKFGPDGRLYTTDYINGRIYVWNLATGTASTFITGTQNMGYIAFLPEPASAVLLACGSALVWRRRRAAALPRTGDAD